MNTNLLIVVLYNLVVLIAASWIIVFQGWSPWWYGATYFFLLDVDKARTMSENDDE